MSQTTTEFLVDFLKKSIRAEKTTLPVMNDQAYIFTDSDLEEILKVALLAQCPSIISDITSIDLNSTPTDQAYFVILKAKEEVYYRLATSSAPFYPIEAEGASLRKDYRFEHYMSLVRRVEQEYSVAWDKYETDKTIDVGEVTIAGYHYTRRNYNKANMPTVEIVRSIPHSNSIDIEWSKFSVFGGLSLCYKVYLGTGTIYDEFEETLSSHAKLVTHEPNIHKNKFRIKGLMANTTYSILVVSEDRNGLKGYVEIQCTTLPLNM